MKRRYLISVTIATLLPIMTVGAASATFMPGGIGNDWQKWIGDNLGNPLEQVQQQISKGDEILGQIMKGSLGSVWDESIAKTGGAPPDPYQVRTAETDVSSGILTTNPIVHKRDAANLYDQELSRATAAPVLGDTGRKWLEQEVKKTGAIVQNNQQGTQATQKLAQDAQGLSVTQDVMKNNQAKLTADNQTSLLKLQQLQGTIAQLTANTSEGIDETNRRDRVTRQIELSSATQAEVYIPGLFRTNQPTAGGGK
jgi:hypothetical protein